MAMGAPRGEIAMLDDALELFWDRFFKERSDFRTFSITQADEFPASVYYAITQAAAQFPARFLDYFRSFAIKQTDLFPASFIDEFLEALNVVAWSRAADTGYDMARKTMLQMAEKMKKKMKKKLEKQRQKVVKQQQLAQKVEKKKPPLWELQKSVSDFWETYDSCHNDLRSFAQDYSKTKFPEKFIPEFLSRLDRAGWTQEDYMLPKKILERLTISCSEPSDHMDHIEAGIILFKRIEAYYVKEDAEARRAALDLARLQQFETNKAIKNEKEADKRAAKNSTKEVKRIRKVHNQVNRLRGTPLGP